MVHSIQREVVQAVPNAVTVSSDIIFQVRGGMVHGYGHIRSLFLINNVRRLTARDRFDCVNTMNKWSGVICL